MNGLYLGGWIFIMIVGQLFNDMKQPTTVEYNDYQMFYGTWQYTEVVSQHTRLGGDEGYEDLIGQYVTYKQDYFECGESSVNNPEYSISIVPIKDDAYNQFFAEQKGIEILLPEAEFMVFIQIIHKPAGQGEYFGNEFFIKNNDTMYSFENNCIYKLTRINYLDNYDETNTFSYQERW